ncbi:hypothetical protein MHB43_03995 [Paenibacillus sp. FSL H8-0317]|uniref:hypothetical protein n=1 Tax=Paenibacillus sp. FSL H8-0317 TaxID=2921385 RepID=UPI00324BB05F
MSGQFVGMYEIAKIANVTNAAVTNWRKRYSDFPKAVAELKSGPIFNTWEIDLWLNKRGHITSELPETKGEKNVYKKIVLSGRARTGKSRVSARLIRYQQLFFKYFVGPGRDFTKVNVRLVLKKKCSDQGNHIRFISPNSTINGIQENFDEDGVIRFLDNIKNHNNYSKSHEKAGEKKDLDPKEDFIEITTEASDLAISIMNNTDEGLIVTDTPGVSGDVEGLQNVSDADVYIFVMRSDNGSEFTDSINKMIPVLAGSATMFIYNMGTSVENDTDYEDMTQHAQIAMHDFSKDLAKLSSGSIISTSIEVLNPSATVIPMGSFHDRKINFAEQKFNEQLSVTLKEMLHENPHTLAEKDIVEVLNNPEYSQEEIVEFIKTTLSTYNVATPVEEHSTFVDAFLLQRHDRVKFNDYLRTVSLVNENRVEILNKLYDNFDVLKVNENLSLPKMIQEIVIQYCYKKLTLAVKFDCGISRGDHPFESNPPITMWAEEAIIAEDLIKSNATTSSNAFCSVMKAKGYTSSSWNYVRVPEIPYFGEYQYCNKKLEVIEACKLNKLPSENSKELIFNSYNVALLKLGQYSVCDFVIKSISSSDDAMNWVKSLK